MIRGTHAQAVPYKHMETHPAPVDGCFGCKVIGVGFGSVPGGTRPGSKRLAKERHFNKSMHAYREARRAGEKPEGTSLEAIERTRRKRESQERAKKILSETNDTSVISKMKVAG